MQKARPDLQHLYSLMTNVAMEITLLTLCVMFHSLRLIMNVRQFTLDE